MSWAKCNECGGEVWFDAWVDLEGNVCGGPYDTTHCEECDCEVDYVIVEGEADSASD